MNRFTFFFHKLISPAFFFRLSGLFIPPLMVISLVLMSIGLFQGLWLAPTDYQQGDAYRIIFIHVPSAWMSLFVYIVLAINALVVFVWRVRIAEIAMIESAYIGAWFTALALITGSIWGKPMWGTFWVWDARLTSELLLFFLYCGLIAIYYSFNDYRRGARAAALLGMVGIINIPIIHFSVEWWNSLHQGPTISKLDSPSIHADMLVPLLIMAIACKLFYLLVLLIRMRAALLERDKDRNWVKQYYAPNC